jgi:hypothetical protein
MCASAGARRGASGPQQRRDLGRLALEQRREAARARPPRPRPLLCAERTFLDNLVERFCEFFFAGARNAVRSEPARGVATPTFAAITKCEVAFERILPCQNSV